MDIIFIILVAIGIFNIVVKLIQRSFPLQVDDPPKISDTDAYDEGLLEEKAEKAEKVEKVEVEKEPIAFERDSDIQYFDLNIEELRRAIIWSEILAPPLSLRDE